eukprot:7925225-Pyramimonas_sp.AAC.1
MTDYDDWSSSGTSGEETPHAELEAHLSQVDPSLRADTLWHDFLVTRRRWRTFTKKTTRFDRRDAKEKVVASLHQEKDIMAMERVSRGQVKRVLGIETIMMTKWCRLFPHPITRSIEKVGASGEPILADPTDRYCGAT